MPNFHLTAPLELSYSYFCWEKDSSDTHHSLHRVNITVPLQPNVLCYISSDNLEGNFGTGCSERRCKSKKHIL